MAPLTQWTCWEIVKDREACCACPRGRKESDTTERMSPTNCAVVRRCPRGLSVRSHLTLTHRRFCRCKLTGEETGKAVGGTCSRLRS